MATPTATVWLLHLSNSTLVVGPFHSADAAAESGRGRLSQITVIPSARTGPVTWREGMTTGSPFPPHAFPVQDGLVTRMDDVPTVSLREEFSPLGRYWWLPDNFRLVKQDGSAYSDEELDARHVDRAAIQERLGIFRKLTRL